MNGDPMNGADPERFLITRIVARAVFDADTVIPTIVERYEIGKNRYLTDLVCELLELRDEVITSRLPGPSDIDWSVLQKELDAPNEVNGVPTVFLYLNALEARIIERLLMFIRETRESFND